MSHTLTLNLSDQVFDAIQRQAAATGLSPSEAAAVSLEAHLLKRESLSSPAQNNPHQEEVDPFEVMFGSQSIGHPHGTDNARIDEDLAREYADSHENQ